MYAINENGTKKWEFKTNGPIYSASPSVDKLGNIYIGSNDNRLYSVSKQGIKKIGSFRQEVCLFIPDFGRDGTIYFGSYDSFIYALNLDGTKNGSLKTGRMIYSSPTIDQDGTIYIGSYDHKLYAMNPDGTKNGILSVVELFIQNHNLIDMVIF